MFLKLISVLTCIISILFPTFFKGTPVAKVNREKTEFSQEEITQDLTVMTFNVKVTGTGNKAPNKRAPNVIDRVKEYRPDSVGFQEASEQWINWLDEGLEDYAKVGIGRDANGKGEASPIYYLKSKYELVDSGTFWLSKTPERPSRGWDAMFNRICTYAILQDKETGVKYAHFNAHFDHIGFRARRESVALISAKMARISRNMPTVFTGDLNDEEGSNMYNLVLETGLRDSKFLAENTMDCGTYHGYSEIIEAIRTKPIDFVFVNDYCTKVESYYVDKKQFDGVYPSDHHSLVVKLTVTKGVEKVMYRVMSSNVLCWGSGKHSIEKRIPLMIKMIREYMPDSVGFQEAHKVWIDALVEGLPEYDYVGIGRDDGKEAGEYAAVFYRKDIFTASDSGHFWISETPEKPSLGWDSACIRMATYVKLTDKVTGKSYIHINTHLDHVGSQAQINGANMIKEKAASFGGLPVVCTGDFNVAQGSDCYQTMISENLGDARFMCEDTDDSFTFHGFNPLIIQSTIDFIFVDKETIQPQNFKVVDKKIEGEFYSDHYAIYADIEII